MPTYTTSAKVQQLLPSSLPAGFVTNYMATFIADASAQVEDLVGPEYGFNYNSSTQKFPEVDASPATPALIELLARWIAAAEAFQKLKEINKLSGKDMETRLRKLADDKLDLIRSGDIVISLSGANIKSSGIDNTTDQHLYDTDATDPIFNEESMGNFL